MEVLLCVHRPPLAAAGAQRGKHFVPLLFPGDADGEVGLLPAAGGCAAFRNTPGTGSVYNLVLCREKSVCVP